MAQVNIALSPGFTLEVVQGANPVIPCTVFDRSGNIIDLTGKTLKLAVRQFFISSNGYGRLTRQPYQILDVTAGITDAANGNITLAFSSAKLHRPGSFEAELRIWSNATVTRIPDDAYFGTLVVKSAVVRQEA